MLAACLAAAQVRNQSEQTERDMKALMPSRQSTAVINKIFNLLIKNQTSTHETKN